MYAGVNFPRENMYRKRPDRLAGASRFASARLSIKQRLRNANFCKFFRKVFQRIIERA